MVGMRIADVQEDIDHELISKEEISDIINCAAAQASEDYGGKNPLLVCVLEGAVNTLAAFFPGHEHSGPNGFHEPVELRFRHGVERQDHGSSICPRMCEDAMC